jgi:hypothetical protein
MSEPSIWEVIFTALVSGTVVSAILGLIFHRRLKSVEARLNEELQPNVEIFRTTRAEGGGNFGAVRTYGHAIRPDQTRI